MWLAQTPTLSHQMGEGEEPHGMTRPTARADSIGLQARRAQSDAPYLRPLNYGRLWWSLPALCFLLLLAFTPRIAWAQGGPPQITMQPQSLTVTQGTRVTFTIEASSLSYLTYQWRFNGSSILGATNGSYVIVSAQPTDAGDYSVALTNAVGWVMSSNASLTIVGSPTITTQPTGVTTGQNGNASFSVAATGAPDLSYQWHFNGTNIPDALGPDLQMSNLQVWQSGLYSVTVSNAYGSVLSSNALLIVTLDPGTATTWGDDSYHQSTIPLLGSISNSQTFNTSGAESFPGEPDHCGYPPCASYWLPYLAPLSGTLTINTVGTDFNAVLAVYTGADMSNLVAVACSGNHGVQGETVTFAATGGSRYFVVVEGVDCAVGQAIVNFNLSVAFAPGVKAVAAGGYHSLVLKTNGVVLGWGDNTYRQVIVPPTLNGVKAIAAGYFHSLALRTDGTVVVWGDNSEGQTNLPPGLKDVTSIAAGAFHNLALHEDGTVTAWGSNTNGQTDVPPGLSNIVLIAAGYSHSLAQTSDGTIVGWGSSDHGETSPPSALSGVVALACGDGFSLALKDDGTIIGWGDDTYGQIDIPPGLTNAVAISAGRYHVLALRENGTVSSWGSNSQGQTKVPFVLSVMTAISAGAYHNMALKGNGAPVITVQPRSLRVNPGIDVKLPVMAVGNCPLSFQWRFNEEELPGATGTVLTITNVQPFATGTYSVSVSNNLGVVMSSDAVLVVGTAIILGRPGLNSTGSFQFDLTGPGGVYLIDYSTDLLSWPTLATTSAPPGKFIFIDTTPPDPMRRFYRARLQ